MTAITQLMHGMMGALIGTGYPGIAAIVGLESAGLPLPGETTLIAASYLAATGRLSLPLVIGAATLGAVLGDSLGYFAGHKGARSVLERYGKWVKITPEKLSRADACFAHYGAKTVFFGRFMPLLRILAGPLAGASRMPYRKFLAANASGAATWATVVGTLAFFLGKPVAALLSSLGIWTLVVISALLLARLALKRRRSSRACDRPQPCRSIRKDE